MNQPTFLADLGDAALLDPAKQRVRILSIDGGGIYGLTSAIWLRRLCAADPHFLDSDCIHLLAGCSSGAINCLLLAKHESPREAVLRGELEQFWLDHGTFVNSDPLGQTLSFLGISSWFFSRDFLTLLTKYFGDLRLGDLKHSVHITTYNWTGQDNPIMFEEPDSSAGSWTRWNPFSAFINSADAGNYMMDAMSSALGSPFGAWMQAWMQPWRNAATSQARAPGGGARAADTQAAEARSPSSRLPSRAGQNEQHWRPKFFNNVFTDDPDYQARVIDVAYAAATPPGFRAIRGGLGDGASFSANPSVSALALVVKTFREIDNDKLRRIRSKQVLRHTPWSADAVSRVLERTAVLSIGSGQKLPRYSRGAFDLGFQAFAAMPTNPHAGAWLPPAAYSLDPASSEADFILKEFVSRDSALRLNPGLIDIPTVMAAYIARFPMWKQWLIDRIYEATASQQSENAVRAAIEFLSSKNWRGEEDNEPTSHAVASPAPGVSPGLEPAAAGTSPAMPPMFFDESSDAV